jgi:hypothetical protein
MVGDTVVKKILFLSLLIVMIASGGCSKNENEPYYKTVNPSFTTYNFDAEGGSVTLIGDIGWAIGFIREVTDSKGVQLPVLIDDFPEGEFFELIFGDLEGEYSLLKVLTSWATITRETIYKAVIDVQPNTSENERKISFEMSPHGAAGGVSIKITQSAE